MLALLGYTGCVVDDAGPILPNVVQPSCVNLPPPPGPFFEWNTLFPRRYDAAACLNPNDPSELIHFRYDFQERTDSIFRFDLGTRQRHLLATGLNVSYLEWGKSDWILIDVPGIWKMRTNGEELSQINLPGTPFGPRWNPAGDQFAVFLNVGGGESGYRIADLDGNILQDIRQIGVSDWYSEDSLLGYSLISGTQEQGIYLMNLKTEQMDLIMPVPRDSDQEWNGIRQMQMFSDHDRIAVLTGNGLWIVSAKSKTVKRLAWSCDNRRMMSVRVHPNDRILFVEENGYEQVDSVTVRNTVTVLRMSAETGERLDTLFISSGG